MVTLKKLTIKDASRIAQLLNNKNIWDNLRDYVPYPYHESDAIAFIEMTSEEDPQITFGIESSAHLCGVIGLVPRSDVYRHSCEIGYWVGEEYWGQGIATKAIGIASQYAFEVLDIERIYTGVFEYNIASMRVLEKNGYQKEGIFKNAILKNGSFCNEHRYAVLRGTFL